MEDNCMMNATQELERLKEDLRLEHEMPPEFFCGVIHGYKPLLQSKGSIRATTL